MRAVDLNGNRGAPTVIMISDTAGGGCSLGHRRGAHASAMLLALAALLATRRRRSRRDPA